MTVQAQFPDEQSADGAFVRQEDAFRDMVEADPQAQFPLAAGRYHLYVSLACPWAHRTIIMRELLGLHDAVGMTVVDPIRDERGWRFADVPGATLDPINNFTYLSEAYTRSMPEYAGRVTVPVLWDTVTGRIVSNSDDDILRMFETVFLPLAKTPADYYPAVHRAAIDALNAHIFDTVNDGVYQAGFATSQAAYEAAVIPLFASLDALNERLAGSRFLFGAAPVETDIRLFVTLIRFDAVYVGHFKCNIRRIADYANLWPYVRDIYALPGVAQTVSFDHIKRHYYVTHDDINPTRIVPVGPELDLDEPAGRSSL